MANQNQVVTSACRVCNTQLETSIKNPICVTDRDRLASEFQKAIAQRKQNESDGRQVAKQGKPARSKQGNKLEAK